MNLNENLDKFIVFFLKLYQFHLVFKFQYLSGENGEIGENGGNGGICGCKIGNNSKFRHFFIQNRTFVFSGNIR